MLRKLKLFLLMAMSCSTLYGSLDYSEAFVVVSVYSIMGSAGIGALTGAIQGAKGGKAPVLTCGVASTLSAATIAALLIKVITKVEDYKHNIDLHKFISENLDEVKCIAAAGCIGSAALTYLVAHAGTSAVRNLVVGLKDCLKKRSIEHYTDQDR